MLGYLTNCIQYNTNCNCVGIDLYYYIILQHDTLLPRKDALWISLIYLTDRPIYMVYGETEVLKSFRLSGFIQFLTQGHLLIRKRSFLNFTNIYHRSTDIFG